MRRTTTVLLGAALTLGAGTSSAQAAGGLDFPFGLGGVTVKPMSAAAQDRFFGVTPDLAGTGVFAVGFSNAGGTDNAMSVAKITAAGAFDSSFSSDGIATVNVVAPPFAAPPAGNTPTGSGEIARGVGVQSDGKVVIAGQAETATSPAPFDSRDVDVYVARFTTTGALDTTFAAGGGTPGTLRINLSNGDSTGTALVSDQAWGLNVLADDSIVVTGRRGTDIVKDPAKLDADFGLVKLTPAGVLDGSFGNVDQDGLGDTTDGVALANENAPGADPRDFSENPRQSIVEPGGKITTGGYSSLGASSPHPAHPNRPILARFNADGTLDTTFDADGVATAEPLGPSPAFSEAYDIGRQSTGGYVLTGYGNLGAGTGGVDMVTYRFTAGGTLDPTFNGGLGYRTFDRAGLGLEDRGRDLVVLADDSYVIAGSSVGSATVTPPSTAAAPQLDATAYKIAADGTLDTSFDGDGVLPLNFGGPQDAFFGSTVLPGGKVVLAGYCGMTPSSSDQSVLAKLDLSGGVSGPGGVTCAADATGPAGPAGADGDDGADGPAGPTGATGATGPAGAAGTTGATGPGGTAGPAGSAGPAGPAGAKGDIGPRGLRGLRGPSANIRVSCRLVPPRRRTITCTVRRVTTTRGAVRVRVARAGRTIASGQTMALGTSALVRLKGAVRAGQRYTLVTTLPAGPRTRTKVITRITLR